jgi:hypothetical protein
MVLPLGDSTEARETGAALPSANGKPKPAWTDYVDPELAFRLIDSILPFEACLYHQVLPMSLEGSRLRLGMVNLDDSAALDYVRRILAYMNCSLVPQTLSSEIHYAALSAYLNYVGNRNQSTNAQSQSLASRIGRKLVRDGTMADATEDQQSNDVSEQVAANDPSNNPTFLVDSPDDLLFAELQGTEQPLPPPVIQSTPEQSASIASDAPLHLATTNLEEAVPTSEHNSASPTPLAIEPSFPPELPLPIPGAALPTLELAANHLSAPINTLATLPPHDLLQELLARVLIGGIGRLYLEQRQQHGRILWSQNGVLQSVLETLPLETIQQLITELKQLTNMPLAPVQSPQQVEIERFYQRHRLLLRLRVMPGTHGEEATVQVLRGAALKFHQQQQLTALGRDALSIAQELQRKIDQIRNYTCSDPTLIVDQLGVLPVLDQAIQRIERQLEELKLLRVRESVRDQAQQK